MEQLLRITRIPMKFELNISSARVERNSQKSQVDVNRVAGVFKMKSRPAQLLLNTKDARDSISPSPVVSIRQLAQNGLQAAQNATSQYAMEGRELLNAKPGDQTLNQIFSQRVAQPTGEFEMAFLPSVGPDIQYVEPDLQLQYQADKLQFDVRVSKGDLQFIPGDVSLEVTQWPDMIIEYMGKPMYVPPSAASRFEARA